MRLAGDLHDGTHLDAGLLHIDDEERQTLVLGEVGVGAERSAADVGDLRAGRPYLLSVQDPLAVVTLGLRLHAGQVGPGARLAEELAEDLVVSKHLWDPMLLLLLGAVGEQRRDEEAEAEAVHGRDGVRSGLAVVGDLVRARQSLSAVLLWDGDSGEPGVVQLRLELAG